MQLSADREAATQEYELGFQHRQQGDHEDGLAEVSIERDAAIRVHLSRLLFPSSTRPSPSINIEFTLTSTVTRVLASDSATRRRICRNVHAANHRIPPLGAHAPSRTTCAT